MKVQIDKVFPLPADADAAWAFVQDIEAVARCMPGTRITERVDERHYKATVSVRIGPASMSFRGEVEVRALDPGARSLRLVGNGTDSTGSSGASMDLTARIEGDGSASRLLGASEVSVSGKAAAFGARLLGTVADQVLQQFAGNVAAELGARAQAGPPASAGGQGSGPAGAPPADAGNAEAAGTAREAVRELSAFALAWALFKGWLRALLGRRSA